ncbi:MAG: DUF542 domain-containing protein [Sediminibacterium magnilacihabitans]|nr:DUF542 domain-containing protein [Sediminibacterium magnilacihabitans]
MTSFNIPGKEDQLPLINKKMPVTDIVQKDYRTADVFLKYDIEFCCGGKWPLEIVCESKQLDTNSVLCELEEACRLMQLPQGCRFEDWSTGFLIDFVQNVYHPYFKRSLELAVNYTNRFLEGHLKKFPELEKMREILDKLSLVVNKRMNNEEESFFPYIKQVTNAYLRNESYAGLLVKTLRKPWQETMHQEYSEAIKWLDELRSVTKDYYLPGNACTTHRVSFLKLQELDHELTRYLQLEHTILLPRVVQVEQALLA